MGAVAAAAAAAADIITAAVTAVAAILNCTGERQHRVKLGSCLLVLSERKWEGKLRLATFPGKRFVLVQPERREL